MSWIVVRARSDVKVERSIRETMGMLNLTRVNHAVIIPENPQYKGMLQKAKDYITWGDADASLIEKMISERGRLVGDKPITDADGSMVYSSIKEFAAIASGDATVRHAWSEESIRITPTTWPKGLGVD